MVSVNDKALNHQTGPLRKRPIAVAHRGFNALFPENTMLAFVAAVKAGAQCIETDIHLSRDGVAVLSHDATLKRCFGNPNKIIDYDVEQLQTFPTLREPHTTMPTLAELLHLLSLPSNDEVSVVLDIKTDNIAEDVMQSISNAISTVNEVPGFWNGRIKLGIWNLDWVPLCARYLPGYPMTYIGFSIPTATEFLSIPGVSFNMFFPSIVGPQGALFLRKARALDREVYVWTLNNKILMRWAISLKVDGVCTDEVVKFLTIVDQWNPNFRFRMFEHIGTFLTVWGFKIVLRMFTMLNGNRHRIRLREPAENLVSNTTL